MPAIGHLVDTETGNAAILAPVPKRKRVLCQLAYIADRVLLHDQRTDERNKVLRSCASDGADQSGSALIRMFHGLLLSGESACKGECQCLAPMRKGHAGQGFQFNTGNTSGG